MSDAARAAEWLDALWNREGVLLAFTDYRDETARVLALYAAEQTAALRAALKRHHDQDWTRCEWGCDALLAEPERQG